VTSARSVDPASVPVEQPAAGACAAVDDIDFTAVFRDFGAYVPGLLRRLGVAEREVEDVAQDVFTVIHRQLPGFRGDSTLKTWVCGVTLRVARSHLRLARVRKLVLGEPATEPSQAPPQLESAVLAERVRMLQRALEELSHEQRRVFVLYELEELSMRDIARLLACPEKTAYTRLHAARQNVERAIRRRLALGGEL